MQEYRHFWVVVAPGFPLVGCQRATVARLLVRCWPQTGRLEPADSPTVAALRADQARRGAF